MIGPIQITRDEGKVLLSLQTYIPLLGNRVFKFDWNAGNEWAAALLQEAMNKCLGDKLKAIKQAAYEQGWKDARGRKKRKTEFYGDFDTDVL